MGVSIQQTRYETLEAGEYPATVQTLEAAEGQFGPQLKWTFDLGDGHKLSAWTSQVFSPKSKLYRWAMACFGGKQIPETYTLNTDHLIGRTVRVIVVVQEGKDGPYNRISEVLAPKRTTGGNGAGTQQVKAAPPPPPPDEEVDWLDAVEVVPF